MFAEKWFFPCDSQCGHNKGLCHQHGSIWTLGVPLVFPSVLNIRGVRTLYWLVFGWEMLPSKGYNFGQGKCTWLRGILERDSALNCQQAVLPADGGVRASIQKRAPGQLASAALWFLMQLLSLLPKKICLGLLSEFFIKYEVGRSIFLLIQFWSGNLYQCYGLNWVPLHTHMLKSLALRGAYLKVNCGHKGGALIRWNWCLNKEKKRHQGSQEKKPYEDTARRRPPASRRGRRQQKPTLPTPAYWTFSLQKSEKIIFWYLSH